MYNQINEYTESRSEGKSIMVVLNIRKFKVYLLGLLIPLLVACAPIAPPPDGGGGVVVTEPTPIVVVADEIPNYWMALFSTPGLEGNHIERALINFINRASTSIHIAAFEFDLPNVANALIAAQQRGVEVLWVTDDEYGVEADLEEEGLFPLMTESGVIVKDDNRTGLMHNKFIIFDQRYLMTGSTNLTYNGTMRNNNNMLFFDSVDLAGIYEREFQEMWAGQFGITSPSTVPEQRIQLYDSNIQVLFGPEDDVISTISEYVSNAESSVIFMAFSFTQEPLGFIMRYNARAGVRTAGLFELRNAKSEYSEMGPFACEGVLVRMDGNSRFLHHKVIIIDEKIVITGSFNFSANADSKNDENLMIIENPEIASLYLAEFIKLWGDGKTPVEGEDYTCP